MNKFFITRVLNHLNRISICDKVDEVYAMYFNGRVNKQIKDRAMSSQQTRIINMERGNQPELRESDTERPVRLFAIQNKDFTQNRS